MAEPVQINQERYEYLIRRDAVLSALEAGGVDNWEWYDEALSNVQDG
jgi:hypothetical protein